MTRQKKIDPKRKSNTSVNSYTPGANDLFDESRAQQNLIADPNIQIGASMRKETSQKGDDPISLHTSNQGMSDPEVHTQKKD